jgi:hypothetical protein
MDFPMEKEVVKSLQSKLNSLDVSISKDFYDAEGIKSDFIPWTSGLSPSALYNCSLKCRKSLGMKTPEVKWISIKRWTSELPETQLTLPNGIFYSIKRLEEYEPNNGKPYLKKTEYFILLLPHGNICFMNVDSLPLNEVDFFKMINNKYYIESVIKNDIENPMKGYLKRCKEMFDEEDLKRKNNEDNLLWIHMKRKIRNNDY